MFCRIRSHPREGHRLKSTVVCVPPHSMGSGARAARKLKSAVVFNGVDAENITICAAPSSYHTDWGSHYHLSLYPAEGSHCRTKAHHFLSPSFYILALVHRPLEYTTARCDEMRCGKSGDGWSL